MLGNYVEQSAGSPLPGTGLTVNLGAAPAGRRRWRDAFATGTTVFYAISDGTQMEWGIGTLTHGSPDTLSRSTVLGNSLGTTTRLNFSGACRVYNEVPAERSVFISSNGLPNLDAGFFQVPCYAGLVTGSANQINCAITPAPGALAPGLVIRAIAAYDNTDRVYLNLNGLGNYEVLRSNQWWYGATLSLGAGAIRAGRTFEVMFDGAYWRMLGSPEHAQIPVGAYVPYSGAILPPGYLWPDGRNVSRAAYPDLHAVYQASGYPHGAGDGSTTFGIPDARGRTLFGRDNMGGTAANRLTSAVSGVNGAALGASGGSEHLQNHTHGVTDAGHTHTGATDTQGSHTHPGNKNYLAGDNNGSAGPGAFSTAWNAVPLDIAWSGAHWHNIWANNSPTGISINAVGGGLSQNIPPALVCNVILFAGG